MTWTISPESYDVVVIGSGLPECLVAASLIKSGKSVLLIDAVDTYGTDFASFTPVALHELLVENQPPQRQQQQTHAINTNGSTDASSAPAPSTSSGGPDQAPSQPLPVPSQPPVEHEHSMPACSPLLEPLTAGCRLLRLSQRPLPLFGVRSLSVPGEGSSPADRRGYILDLVPKMVYQGEALVDLLVRCRCHHYLEFKALEGSYLLQDGALQPVPAGRADIFRDKRLSLGDKRALMRFIQGCMESRSGQGHLQEALSLSSSTPLAQVLQAEGLSPRLREVILYGIAMCDTDQEPPSQPLPQPPPAPAPSTLSPTTQHETPYQQAVTLVAESDTAASPSDAGARDGTRGAPGDIMSGGEGGAALELFTSSQGRFGQEAAFMIPSYGSGSVAEAFVRLCAVHGAVTVLRQPVQALAVRDVAPAEEAPAEEAPGVGPTVGAAEQVVEATAGAAEAPVTSESPEGLQPGAKGPQPESDGGGHQAAPAVPVAAAGAAGRSDGGDDGGRGGRCIAVVTAAGQAVHCGTVVAGISTLRCLEGIVTQGAQPESVSRAVVVLDGPLLPAPCSAQQPAAPSLTTLVVPPRCQGLRAAGDGGSSAGCPDIGNPHPVRALQQGASTCVCPAGRFVLYLSTPATSASAYDDLRPTLDALVDTSGLQDPTAGPGAAADAMTTMKTMPEAVDNATAALPAAAAPSASDAIPNNPQLLGCYPHTSTSATTAANDKLTETASTPSSAIATGTVASAMTVAGSAPPQQPPARPRPRALRAWFFRQPVLHRLEVAASLSDQLPRGVVAVPGADGALAGYDRVLRATEAVFRSAFPDATWLAEVDFKAPGGGEGGEGGGVYVSTAGAADEDDDAIDELSAVVARLKGI